MRPSIHPFRETDYPALRSLFAAVYPDYPGWVTEMLHHDQHPDPRSRRGRWVAEQAGQLVGMADFDQPSSMYHPRRFSISLQVHPSARRQGIGQLLYARLLAELAPFEPISLTTETREDEHDACRFLERRGFLDVMREWESRLNVVSFDPAPFADALAAVQARGIELRSLNELAADPERDRKLFALRNELDRDVPSPEPTTEPDFEQWRALVLTAPYHRPDAYFVALDGDAYVGLSYVTSAEDGRLLETGLTGVCRPYRRQGIALALKLKVIDYARQQGYTTIMTWNETGNAGMLALNQQLGFVRQPAWVSYQRQLRPEAE